VYAGLGIQEVWVFKVNEAAFTVHTLKGDAYEVISSSEILPEAPLDRIAHFALLEDQHEALKAFRAELREAPLRS